MSKEITYRIATKAEIYPAMMQVQSMVGKGLPAGDVEIAIRRPKQKRTLNQNALQWKWCQEASEQGDQTASEYQAWCKLHIGMDILCRDDEDYAQACRNVLGELTYEQKLALMRHPFDWPVTRAMTKKQLAEYLDRVWQHFTGQGMRLTDPGLKGINANDYREVA